MENMGCDTLETNILSYQPSTLYKREYRHPDDKPFPMFRCGIYQGQPSHVGIAYCTAEKMLLAINVIVLGLLLYQISVYMHSHRLNLSDKRI